MTTLGTFLWDDYGGYHLYFLCRSGDERTTDEVVLVIFLSPSTLLWVRMQN
jgi:hypothetical protein